MSFGPAPAEDGGVTRFARVVSFAVLTLGAIVILAGFLSASLWLLTINFPFAYGEGPIVRDAWLLSNGELFYRVLGEDPPYSLSNYTPVYYTILAGLLHFTGLSFVPGRFLSLVMGIGVLSFVYRVVTFYSGDKQSGFAAALVLLASPFAGNLALNRVDATAAFFSVGSITLLLTRARTPSVALWAGALAALAALTRQTSFIFPLLVAAGLCIGERRWRELGFFLFSLSAIAGGVSGVLEVASAGAYSFNVILSNINSFEWDRLVIAIGSIGESFYASLIAVVFVMFRRRDVSAHRPVLGLLLIAAVPSFVSIAKSGSNLNYLTEMCVALSVIFGIVVGSLSDKQGKAALVTLVVAALVVPRVQSVVHLPQSRVGVTSAQANATQAIAFIASLPGPVLSDDLMGVELLAKKEIVFQPYEINQLQRVGRWRDRGLRKILRTGRAGMVLVSAPYRRTFVRRERWSVPQWRFVRRDYRAAGKVFGSIVFVARR